MVWRIRGSLRRSIFAEGGEKGCGCGLRRGSGLMIETTWRWDGEGKSGREAHWEEDDDRGWKGVYFEGMRHRTEDRDRDEDDDKPQSCVDAVDVDVDVTGDHLSIN